MSKKSLNSAQKSGGIEISVDSEMAWRFRAFDWSATPLGAVETWPQSLRTAVGICLNSRFPMFVWWGPQFINIHNDAYSKILGKRHPDALGQPARKIWAEIWADVGPQAEAVLEHGQATWNERVYLRMERHGYPEDTWFTWSYSPIPDEAGNPGGVFCACTEDTAYVIAERERMKSVAEFEALLDVIPVGIGIAFDPLCKTVRTNAAFARVLGLEEGRNASKTAPEDERPMNFRCLDTNGDEVPDDQLPLQIAAREGKAISNLELDIIHEDGRIVRLLEYAVPLFDEEGRPRGAVGAFVDVTEHRNGEEKDKFLIELDSAIRLLADPDAITLTAATLLGGHLAADRCAYAEIEADEDTMEITGNYLRDESVKSITGRLRFSDFGPGVLQLMRDNELYVVNDVDTRSPPVGDSAAYRATQIQAVICVPLHKEGRFAAAMAVHSKKPRIWTPDEIELVQLVASRCWESIERARVTRDLQESEERLRLANAIAKMGTFDIDLQTDDVTVNEAGRAIYGWEPDEGLTFSKVRSYFHPEDREAVIRRVEAAFDPDGPGEFEVEQRIIRRDGDIRWIRVRGRALFERERGKRRAVRCIGAYLDVTDQKRLEAERESLLESERAARSEAERIGRMKDEFLATLSHELRTPLNAIMGWAQLLQMGPPDPEDIKTGIDAIARNSRMQAQLIEDLLDMSRIVSGKIRLDVQPVRMQEVIDQALDAVSPAAEAKGITLQKTIDHRAGQISGDPNRLQQVLWNLLSNAIKFTPTDGQVHVVLELVKNHIEVSVSDTGQGIASKFLPYVFDRFRQADSTITRTHGGLGLGLAIVKQLVELHGGKVMVESPGEGQGTTFTVVLPLAAAKHASYSERQRARAALTGGTQPGIAVKLAGLKVLVVDDHDDARVLVKRLLEENDATVVTAQSGTEALAQLEQEHPDLLICDIGMPGMDGYEVIRRVRALPAADGGRLPAVALTAFARSEDRQRALMAGYQMHLAKPVEPAELLAACARLTDSHG